MRSLCLVVALPLAIRAATPDPPDPSKLLKTYTIDLDLPAEQRWAKVAEDYKSYIATVVADVKSQFNRDSTATLIAAIKKGLDVTVADDEYARELKGLASLTGVPYDDLVVWNSYYELTKARGSGHVVLDDRMCTSIVAQNANGSMYLGHNFDYPTQFGPGMINVLFVKGGKTVWEGSVVAGQIGPMAGVVPGAFAVAIDARGKHAPSMADAVKAAEAGAYGFCLLTRRSMEVATSYDEATKFYMKTPMIAPGYIIYGGVKAGEGAVVTANNSAAGNDLWEMKDAEGWFLVETNYDHWGPAPFTDDRRDPAIKRLKAIGTADISMLGLWNVLSSSPNYRGATISTHLIDIAAGDYRTYLRHSKPPAH